MLIFVESVVHLLYTSARPTSQPKHPAADSAEPQAAVTAATPKTAHVFGVLALSSKLLLPVV